MRTPARLCSLLAALPLAAYAYPNGPTQYITDMVPACASCHAVLDRATMPEMPDVYAESELAKNKHYGSVRAQLPPSPYLELTAEEKESLILAAQQIDEAATVSLSGPAEAKQGTPVTVSIKARGGNGPAIGLMLVDKPYRYQARPATADGWRIVDPPLVKGQGGKEQTTWLDRRLEGTRRNLGFILVMDQRYDPDEKLLPEAEITYTLLAPVTPGDYTLTAALLYGTEDAATAGVFQRPSGRLIFSAPLAIRVR